MTPRQSLAVVATVLLAGAWAWFAHAPTTVAPPHHTTGSDDSAPVAVTAAARASRPGRFGLARTAATGSEARTTPEPVRDAVSVADRLQGYLWRVLGPLSPENTLYDRILRVRVGLHLASIHTDLSLSDHDRAIAERICAVVSRFRESPEGRSVTALDVDVYGSDGQLLAIYEDLAASGVARTKSRSARQAGAMTPTPPADTRPTRSAQPGMDRPAS